MSPIAAVLAEPVATPLSDDSPLVAGDVLDVTVGGISTRAVVTGPLAFRLAGPLPEGHHRVRLSRVGGEGRALAATCDGIVHGAGVRLSLDEEPSFAEAGARCSERVVADRRPVQLEWEGGQRCLRGLVAVDVSSTGCRLSGAGSPPPLGAQMRIDIGGTTYGEQQWLPAEIVRVEVSAFGRYTLGLRFAGGDPADYERVLAWRAASAHR